MPSWTSGRRPDAERGANNCSSSLTHWSAVFGGVIAIGVTIRALAFDFVGRSAIQRLSPCSSATVQSSRSDCCPRLPYRVRAVTLSGACFVAAGSAVRPAGTGAGTRAPPRAQCVDCRPLPGRAGMIGSLLVAGAIVAIVGRPEPVDTFSPWSSAIDVVCVAGVLTVLVQFVVSRLERSLDHSSTGVGTSAGRTGAARAGTGRAHARARDASTDAKARRRWTGWRAVWPTTSTTPCRWCSAGPSCCAMRRSRSRCRTGSSRFAPPPNGAGA